MGKRRDRNSGTLCIKWSLYRRNQQVEELARQYADSGGCGRCVSGGGRQVARPFPSYQSSVIKLYVVHPLLPTCSDSLIVSLLTVIKGIVSRDEYFLKVTKISIFRTSADGYHNFFDCLFREEHPK